MHPELKHTEPELTQDYVNGLTPVELCDLLSSKTIQLLSILSSKGLDRATLNTLKRELEIIQAAYHKKRIGMKPV